MSVATKNYINLPPVFDTDRYPLFPKNLTRLLGVKVYDCGQGDSIGVIGELDFGNPEESQIDVVLHIDYGGYQANPNKKHKFQECLSRWPIAGNGGVILTHWDQDHFWSGYRDPELHSRRWLVPRQKVSPRATIFSTQLSEGKCWPTLKINDPVRFRTKSGDELWIEKLGANPPIGANEDRNRTGLAISIVKRNTTEVPFLIVCPGDAPFDHITHLRTLRPISKLTGVVAYHHGSHVHWCAAQERLLSQGPTVSKPRVIYSCAKNNSYGHPTEQNYRDAFQKTSGILEDLKTYEEGKGYELILFPTHESNLGT